MDDIVVNVQPAGGFCNIRCGYCDQTCRCDNIREFNFDAFEVMLRDIEKTDPHFVTFVLHGGEPLTAAPEVLFRIIDLCEEHFHGKSRVQVQTNGVLLADDISGALFSKRCGFSVSLDPDLGNRRYDCGTRAVVKGNISRLLRLGADIGVVSVAHAYNLDGFSPMLHELRDMGVAAWTINRVRCDREIGFYVSEMDYVNLLLSVMREWIGERLFRSIRILPILDLLTSRGGNHCCRYSSRQTKCSSFFVFNGAKVLNHCEHLPTHVNLPDERCLCCSDYDFCGGGCPAEERDDSFCEARRLLKKTILNFRQFKENDDEARTRQQEQH